MLLYHAGARRSAIAAFALKPALHLAMAISALVMATADDAVAGTPSCVPLPDGSACEVVTCPVDGERCTPRCMRYNPNEGSTIVIECECRDSQECRAVAPDFFRKCMHRPLQLRRDCPSAARWLQLPHPPGSSISNHRRPTGGNHDRMRRNQHEFLLRSQCRRLFIFHHVWLHSAGRLSRW